MVPVYRMERSMKRSWKKAWIRQWTFIFTALIGVHVLERSSICTRVFAAQTYSMNDWLLKGLSQRNKKRKRAFEEWRFWVVCKDKLSVKVAEDAYDVLLSIAISVLSTLLLSPWLHPSHMQSWKATRKTLVFRWSPTVVPAITDSRSCLAIWQYGL